MIKLKYKLKYSSLIDVEPIISKLKNSTEYNLLNEKDSIDMQSISALFNCIGLTLLMRWHSTGLFIVGSTSLLSAVSLSFTCAGWLNYYFGSVGIFVPYVVFAIYLLSMLLLLFVRDKGKTAWQQRKTHRLRQDAGSHSSPHRGRRAYRGGQDG